MSFIFTNLKKLYEDMQDKGETRAVFPITYNNKNFSCLFLSDITPYQLIILPIGDITFAVELSIYSDFSTNKYIENYYQLIKFLEIKFDLNHKFMPEDFFNHINNVIPSAFLQRPTMEQVITASGRCREIEHGEQLFFCGLRRNPKNERVSPKNHEKTRIAFGDKTAKLLKLYNISTCWTDDENKRNLSELNKFLSTH